MMTRTILARVVVVAVGAWMVVGLVSTVAAPVTLATYTHEQVWIVQACLVYSEWEVRDDVLPRKAALAVVLAGLALVVGRWQWGRPRRAWLSVLAGLAGAVALLVALLTGVEWRYWYEWPGWARDELLVAVAWGGLASVAMLLLLGALRAMLGLTPRWRRDWLRWLALAPGVYLVTLLGSSPRVPAWMWQNRELIVVCFGAYLVWQHALMGLLAVRLRWVWLASLAPLAGLLAGFAVVEYDRMFHVNRRLHDNPMWLVYTVVGMAALYGLATSLAGLRRLWGRLQAEERRIVMESG